MKKALAKIVLALIVISSTLLLVGLSLAAGQLSVETNNPQYEPGENIFITVSSAPKTFFNLTVIGPNNTKVYEKLARTDFTGKYFALLKGFSIEGLYDIVLTSNNQTVRNQFTISTEPAPEEPASIDDISKEAVQSPPISEEQPRFSPSNKKAHWVKYVDSLEQWRGLAPEGAENVRTGLANIRANRFRKIEYDAPLPLKPKLTGKFGAKPVRETMMTDLFNLSSYGTEFELVDYHTSPVSQRITYRIFNSKSDDVSYIAITGNIQSFRAWHLVSRTRQIYIENVTYYEGDVTEQYKDAPILEYTPLQLDIESNETYGNKTRVGYPYYLNKTYTAREYDEPELLFSTRGFMEKWYSDDPAVAGIKDLLRAHNINTDLESVLDNSVLPEPEQLVYVYKIPHLSGTWEYFEYETDNTPSKFLAFDPAGGSWWNETWDYRQAINITENSNNNLTEYQIMLRINTQELISQGKINNDCSDIRFTNDTDAISYYIDEGPGLTCNQTDTLIWVQVPHIPANSSTIIYMYYGNSEATSESNITAVFTYSEPKEIYFAIGDFVQRSNVDVISYTDNNNITLNSNGESVVRDAGEIYTGFDAADIQSGDSWNVTGPWAFGCANTDCDTPNPISFAGTEFIRFVDRGGTSKEWFVYAPFGDGTVYFYSTPSGGSYGTPIKTLSVTKRTLYNVTDADGSDDDIFLINSTTPILLAFEYGSRDTQMHVPASNDTWGISEDLAFAHSGTERTLCTQSAACSTTTRNGPYREALSGNSDGLGTATHVNGTKLFGQGQTADSDGYESLVYWPEWELSKQYYTPVAFQYLAGSLTEGSSGSCSWKNGTAGSPTSINPTGSYNYPNPKKVYVGDGTASPGNSYGVAGSMINCTYPFFLSLEPNNDDEANILSWKQARQYIYPEPTYEIEEEQFGAPEVEKPKTYNSTLVENTSFEIGKNVTIRDNATHPNGANYVDSALITIIHPNQTVMVNNNSMTNISAITNGYTYEYNYTIPDELNSIGTWNVHIYANSTFGVWDSNSTSFETYETVSPNWTNLNASNNNPEISEYVNFSCYWQDNYNLSEWIFSWNATGEWTNVTTETFSGTGNWSNTTQQIPGAAAGKTIGYKFYANDTFSNENETDAGTINVQQAPDETLPQINSFNATPLTQGYGNNVTIEANVTDNVWVDTVKANITHPNGTWTWLELSGSGNIYSANFTDMWQWGNYSYWIWANDTSGNSNDTSSSPKKFYVRANASMVLKTEEDIYGANEDVLLTSENWWDISWGYKKPITLTETSGADLTDYQVNLTIDTQSIINQSKMNSDCSDIRFIDSDNVTELSYWIQSGCNTTQTKIWIKVNLSDSQVKTIYMYYGNPDAQSKSNKTKTLFIVGEANISEVGGTDTTVILSRNYTNPVVFAVPRLGPGESRTGTSDTQHHLITNVNSENFTIRQVESPGSGNGYINTTNVSYIILEKGKYRLGAKELGIVVNTTTSTGSYTTANFGQTFTNPVVLADTQTNANGADQIYARGDNLATTSIQLQVEEDDVTTPSLSSAETIAYATIETGTDSLNNLEAKTVSGITHTFVTQTFSNSYSSAPVVVSQLNDEAGSNSFYALTRDVTTSDFELAGEEPASWDGSHIAEVFSWLVMPSGLIYGTKYASSEPTINMGSEVKPSLINNTGATNISGYLLMQVQKNDTGEIIATQINDTNTGTKRVINSGDYLNIGSIYNQNPWNTDSQVTGYYKVYTALTDPYGNVLTSDDGSNITNYYVFYVDITPPTWNSLGANDTNPKPNDNVKFYCNWSDNGQLDSWEFYWNASGSWQKAGEGSFATNPDWSNITKQIPSEAEAKQVGYYFKANDTEGSYNTTDNYTIEVQDVTPPQISSEQVQPSVIHRNETVNITATITDNKDINETWTQIGIPNNGYENKSMSLLSGSTYNLTYKATEIGAYNFTVYANDSAGNLGNGTTNTWTVYGWSNVSWVSPDDGSYPIGTIVNLTCLVKDVNTTQAIQDYPVKFWHNGNELGTNNTNSTGYAVYHWNTSGLDGGPHTVNCTIEDNSTLFYNTTSNDEAHTIVTILVPKMNVSEVEHQNNYTYTINEYEAGDNISWTNITVNNTGGATAYDVNVTLNILDSGSQKVGWGPDETKDCGSVALGELCEVQFNNNSNGYIIPTSTGQGTYSWNITINWTGGGTPPTQNTSYSFTVHKLTDNLSSAINPNKVVQNESSTYNLTIVNPWSKNITDVNITINCPVNMTCNCSLAGQEDQNGYCLLYNITSSSSKTASFNITTNSSTTPADYDINVNVSYYNPGNEQRAWSNQQTQVLSVRGPTHLRVTITEYKTTITRNSLVDLKGYVNNTGDSATNNIWLNWSLPSNWTNQTGNLSVFSSSLGPSEILWNNITANVSINASLGQQQIQLKSESDEEAPDWETKTVTVYTNTSMPYISTNNSNPYRNEPVKLTARLIYDNSSAVEGETIVFKLDGSSLGSNTTNSTGYAVLFTTIPYNANLGSNIINATYSGSSSIYTNPSYNDSLAIDVSDLIIIENVSAQPQTTGYGQNVSIIADIWSRVQIDLARVNISFPDDTWQWFNMVYSGLGNTYEAVLSSLWQWGNYSYWVWANNTAGFVNNTSSQSDEFYVRANASMVLKTSKDVYGPSENVYLQGQHWWNGYWSYRKEIDVTNPTSTPLEEYQIELKENLTQLYEEGKLNTTCQDLRFTWYNSSSGNEIKIPYWIEECNISGKNSTIWVKVPTIPANSDTTVYMYYGNPNAETESNITATFSYSEPRLIGYVTSDKIVSNGLSIMSLCDNNEIQVGSNSYDLNELESTTISSGLSQNTTIKAKCLVQVEGSGNTDDMIVPISWAGTEFIYDGFRDSSDTFCMFAPFGDASVAIYVTGTKQWSGTVNSTGTCTTFDATDDTGLRIVSNRPILVSYYGSAGNDAYSMLPPTTEALYGVPSNYLIAAAGPSGANITYTRSDTGVSTDTSIAANEDYQLSSLGDSGSAPAFVINGSNPIGVIQQADHDGTESTIFAPIKEMTTKFGSALTTEYIAIATPYSDTSCTVYNSSGDVVATSSASGSNGIYKICFGCGNDNIYVSGRWKVECTKPVWPYYEEDSNGDETNLLGWKQMRQHIWPEPIYNVGNKEENSRIINTGATNISGYLLMQVQKNDTGEIIATQINDTNTGTKRVINSGAYLELSKIWDSNPWNADSQTTGYYKIYVALTDSNENILTDDAGESINKSYVFVVDTVSPEINLSLPLNGMYTADTTLNFTFNVTDNFASTLTCSLYVDYGLEQTNSSVLNATETTLVAGDLSLGEHVWEISCSDGANLVWSDTRNFSVYEPRDVNITVINSSSTFENTTISIIDGLGQVVSSKNITSSDNVLSDELALNQNYTVEIVVPVQDTLTAKIINLNITENMSLQPQTIENYTGTIPPKIQNVTDIFALNDSSLSYDYTELIIPKKGLNITNIVHCTDWNFTAGTCSSWEVNDTTDYNMQENSTHIWFNVTHFTAFGGGKSSPLPNITDIKIYNVTGSSDTHVGGDLVDSGLNKTFNFDTNGSYQFRIEMYVRNDGGSTWNIDSTDIVYHEGLNSNWEIDNGTDVWYSIGTTNRTGGNWSDGRVTWDTTLGGTLKKGETATFNYVFNATSSEDEQLPVYFLANETQKNAGSYDYSVFNVTKIGYLNVSLTTPVDNQVVPQNRTFVINATVQCLEGECGYVIGTPRYNDSSSLPDTYISNTSDTTPFFIVSDNQTKQCSDYMYNGTNCTLTWTINSTGNLTDRYEIDVEFNSTTYGMPNSTENHTVEIGIVLILSLTFDYINFSTLQPLEQDVNATGNNNSQYNITIDSNSNNVEGLYIKGTDMNLTSESWGSYYIGITNVSASTTNDIATETAINYTWVQLKGFTASGTNVTTYYWLDLPSGLYKGDYEGTIWIMGNATGK